MTSSVRIPAPPIAAPPRLSLVGPGGPSGPSGAAGVRRLSARELEVLTLMVEGITSNRHLARRLEVSENTVKFHVRNILDKLHLHNRAQAESVALRRKMVQPD